MRSILMVFLLAATVVWGGEPRPAAAAAGSCLPAKKLPVTVLVRSGPGKPWLAMESEEAAPFIDGDQNRTIVPLRSLVTAMSPGTDSVRWYNDTRTATFWYQGHTLSVRFPRGVDVTYTASLDNKSRNFTAYLCNGRVWVGARSVAEAFKVDIQYYPGGIVLIDGAGADPAAAAAEQKATNRVTKCQAFPEGVAGYITSPIRTAHQLVDATACHLAHSS